MPDPKEPPRWCLRPNDKPGRSDLERVQELHAKACGFPRRGVLRSGQPVAPGIACVTLWANGIEADASGARLRYPSPAAGSAVLSGAELAELEDFAAGASELPADWDTVEVSTESL